MQQPVVREERRESPPPANIIPFAVRAETHRQERAQREAAKKQRANDALQWEPDRTEPSPRAPVPMPIVAEGSRRVVAPPVQPLPPAPVAGAPAPAPLKVKPAPAPEPAPAPMKPAPAPQVRAPEPIAPIAPPVAPPTIVEPPQHHESYGPGWTPPAPVNRWAAFEALGLKKPVGGKKQTAQQWMVSLYRGLGFLILTIIVLVLVSYLATTAFYYWNDTWIEPMVVSATDEKVLSLEAQVAAQENERDRIQAELTAAERELAVEQDFQSQFAAAIRDDLAGRKSELGRVRNMEYAYGSARAKVQASNQAYAAASAKTMQQEYKAGLIDRDEMLSGKFQVAQITTSNLGLAEREAEYGTRAAQLDQNAKALEGLLADKQGQGTLSYEVLKIKDDFEKSRLATARAQAQRDALKAALGRENGILAVLHAAPELRAMADKADVAFIPYGNMSHVAKGTKLYACSMEMFWCHEVGTVKEVLPGEVQYKHPHREKMLRGQLVELDLAADQMDSAREDVLFVGSKPLWL
jgi:hypothetical protein